MIAPEHIVGWHIVTTLPNAFPDALDCELRAGEPDIDDTDIPSVVPRLVDEG